MIIDKPTYNKIIDLYPKWKALNEDIKTIYSRGINLHEAFTEIICCYHLQLDLNLNDDQTSDSADAYTREGLKVQIKGSSNCINDLSSFGPKSQFDLLCFCCLDNDNKFLMKIFNIPIINLKQTFVNKNETFFEQQLQQRRPRFSIYQKCILKNDIQPLLLIDLTKKV